MANETVSEALCLWEECTVAVPQPNKYYRKKYCAEHLHHRLTEVGGRGLHTTYPFVTSEGYVQVAAGVVEHRAVMEEILGRPLRKGENVHHRNGVRNDNRPENLELWATPQPPGQRVSDLVCPHCGKTYG